MKNKNNRNCKRKLKYILGIIFLILVSVLILMLQHPKENRIVSGLPDDYGTKKMSDKDMKKYVNKEVEANQVTLEVYPEVDIKSETDDGNMWIRNVPINKVGQQAELLDETGKVISKTGLIKPGYQVDTVKLNRKLSKGTRVGLIRIFFYDLKESKKVGSESVQTLIKVR